MDGQEVEVETALSFLRKQGNGQVLDRKAMRFTQTRLNSLMRLLEISKLDEFSALLDVATFATLLATYTEEGFNVVFEPQGSMVAGINEPLLQLCCLDASIAIKPVFDRFQSVVITSGTLSPIGDYAKLLNFEPVVKQCLPMSTFRDCLLPLIVTRGRDQVPISSKYESRMDPAVIRNFGELLVDTCATVPDGVCAFFTSYSYMEAVLDKWEEWGIIDRIWAHKLIFMETKDVLETQQALDNFKKSCDLGRGAVFLSIARGKVAEGVDFDRHYGRCVLLFGIPIQYTQSHVLRARMAYVLQKYQIREQEFLVFDALRQAAQCVGRVIRSKEDYGIVILADFRYNKQDKRTKMPQWIQQFMRESSLNVSTDVAIDHMKSYLKQMAQPVDRDALEKIVLNEQQVQERQLKASVYHQHANQREIARINKEAQARRPALFGQQAESVAGAAGGFDMDQDAIAALAAAQAEEEQEEALRLAADAYLDEEEEALREEDEGRVPGGGVLESRGVTSDLVLSINKRSDDALMSGSKRPRAGAASSSSSSSSVTGGVMMFVDSDDED
jgi:DNA excision repair protein ERCC-2